MFKPDKTEYDPYYDTYISLVSEEDVRDAFSSQPKDLRGVLAGVPEEKGGFAYADGKWTLKEVLSHLIDGERIFAYRMLRISRGDATPIEGFEQDNYIENSNANNRSIEELVEEFELNRKANAMMLNNMDETALSRMGTASGLPVSVRALANICIGHVRHHSNILEQRYLPLIAQK